MQNGEIIQIYGGEYKIVDDRPALCPNGHGVMSPSSGLSFRCDDCKYKRQVIERVESD